MKYISGNDVLGLADYMKFGIEIEAFNVAIKELYHGESANYINSMNWHMASKSEEALVSKGGAELVSPILHDTKEDWQSVINICENMKKYPGKFGDKVVADEKCGLHVHFDAGCLANDKEKMKNFLRIYAEGEELLYKMCNPEGQAIRKPAINKDYKGIHIISSLWRNGMAAPTGKKLLKKIEDGTLKVSYKKFGVLKRLIAKYKIDERRYVGLNLTNIGNPKKNTIEFRMANGTIDPDEIKKNVFLYASIIKTAIDYTENPEQYQEKIDNFFNTDVTEEEKVNNFLDLIMDSPEDKQIYYNRWNSVKDNVVYAKNDKKGFAPNRFNREQFKNIAYRTPLTKIKEVYEKIKRSLNLDKKIEPSKGELEYDR